MINPGDKVKVWDNNDKEFVSGTVLEICDMDHNLWWVEYYTSNGRRDCNLFSDSDIHFWNRGSKGLEGNEEFI